LAVILRRELRPAGRSPSLRFRPPSVYFPLWLLALGWGLVLTWRVLGWAARHLRTSAALVLAGWLVWADWLLGAAVVACVAAGALCLWWAAEPGSFARRVARPLQLQLREWFTYRRNWQPAMLTSGLSLREHWGGDLPVLRRVREEARTDVLRVRMLPGQTLEQWKGASAALAQTFGARQVRVRRVPDRAQELELLVARGRAPDIRHVTERAAQVDSEPAPAARGAFPRQPRGGVS
jgi:S-DNA-T family DNA segregation ATPase FtsK/SpoIIIE